jgi:serine/threonine-protein kinase
LIFGAAIAGWWFMQHHFQGRSGTDSNQALQSPTSPSTPPTPSTPTPKASTEEQTRKQEIDDRRQKLGIDNGLFTQLVNQEFYATHPDLKGRQLTTTAADAPLRAQWDKIANEFLARLERVSPEARRQMGSYGKADRDRWRKVVNQSNLSTRALYDLADARFFYLFSEYRGTNLSKQPMEQVWHGIASDQVAAIAAGSALETITFPPGRFDTRIVGSLQPGNGRAYIAYFKKGQGLRLTWNADQKALFSLYPPLSAQKPLLEDSQDATWSGTLTESGYYEVVIVADGAEPVNYTIDLAADNISTPTNSASPTPTSSPAGDRPGT